MNLISHITEQILSDDYDESKELEEKYNNASLEEKQIIDSVFLSLCGWTLETLIKKTKNI